MRLPLMRTPLWRSATLLLVSILLLACSLLPWSVDSDGPPATAPDQPPATLTPASRQVAEPTTPTDAPAAPTATPTVEAVTAGPYSLAISNSYQLLETEYIVGLSLAAREGTVWIGTVSGTLEEVDAQSGAFGRSISLVPDNTGSELVVAPISPVAFEGQYLWGFVGSFQSGVTPPRLFALDPEGGEVVQEWDLNSPEWTENYERMFPSEDFGVSPGKIWIDGHIVDTQTFEVQKVPMPGMTLYAYDGREWMWITGEMGSACDELLLINTADPSTVQCPDKWPFLIHTPEGHVIPGPGSPMVLAGDRMWIGGGWSGTNPVYLLEAYPADIDQAMKETEPLASVPLVDSYQKIEMLFAGDYLWVVYTHGQKAGFLYQLDPQTGETINGLDLVGDEGRAISDVPQDMAVEGDNLWVLTTRQLLRIKLP